MTSGKIYISVVLEPDEDWPVADIVYDGVQWASATFIDGQIVVTFYGTDKHRTAIPIDAATESLQTARDRLVEIIGDNKVGPD
jgi:hypothetical protein